MPTGPVVMDIPGGFFNALFLLLLTTFLDFVAKLATEILLKNILDDFFSGLNSTCSPYSI